MARTAAAPERILYTETSTFGGQRELRVHEGVLTCTLQACEGLATDSVTPERSAWQGLWELMEELRAWEWAGEYADPAACDAVRWELEVHWSGRHLRAAGCQRWPGAAGEFERFLGALREMATCDCRPQVTPKAAVV